MVSADEGDHVAGANVGGANRVDEAIGEPGGVSDTFEANVGAVEKVEAMIKCALEKCGRLDVLHNNAIFTTVGHVGEIAFEGWQKTVDVGLTAYWYATKCAIEVMLPRRSGAIVNTASVSGLAGDYTLGAYNAVKAGVVTGVTMANGTAKLTVGTSQQVGLPDITQVLAQPPSTTSTSSFGSITAAFHASCCGPLVRASFPTPTPPSPAQTGAAVSPPAGACGL